MKKGLALRFLSGSKVYPERALASRRGFTLIELVVAIGIMVLMTGISIPFFRNFANKNDLDRAALEVKSAILEARSLSLAPRNVPSSFSAYQFRIYADGTLEIMENSVIKTAKLPSTIQVSFSGFPLSGPPHIIQFSIEKQGAITVPDPANYPQPKIILTSNRVPSGDNTREIIINTNTGSVEKQ